MRRHVTTLMPPYVSLHATPSRCFSSSPLLFHWCPLFMLSIDAAVFRDALCYAARFRAAFVYRFFADMPLLFPAQP